jgi:hypothetical protein
MHTSLMDTRDKEFMHKIVELHFSRRSPGELPDLQNQVHGLGTCSDAKRPLGG